MSTEPISIEGSVTPPTSIDSEYSGVGGAIQTKGTTGKRKATPQRSEVWSHFTRLLIVRVRVTLNVIIVKRNFVVI
ncbi:hypothetical protein Gotur_013791 [Gossypium turneri]